MRGDGRLLKYAGSPYWFMAYYVAGKEVRESTRETDETRAKKKLRKRIAEVLQGEAIPHENKLTLGDLCAMLTTDYQVNGRRSLKTLPYSLRHIRDFFGDGAKAVAITTDRLSRYVRQRQTDGASNASINIELALVGKMFTLAIRARRLRSKPFIPRLDADPSRVRRGFFSREEIDSLVPQLPTDLGDVVRFLFFSAWRVGEARTLEWRDYDRTDGVLRLRAEHSKNKHGRVLPVVGELATIMKAREAARRLDCPFIFHRDGQAIGDFRKAWATACKAIGLEGRIVHDLRRSGVRHLIRAGVAPHTVMAFSGHRTASMLKRYDIIALDDLRAAAAKGSEHGGEPGRVVPFRTTGTEKA